MGIKVILPCYGPNIKKIIYGMVCDMLSIIINNMPFILKLILNFELSE